MSRTALQQYDEQILDLLDGSLPDEQQAELHAWLNESPEHYHRFVQLSFIHSQIASQLHSQRSSEGVRLGALHAESGQAELPPIHLPSSAPLSKKHLASAMAYVYEHTVTPKHVVAAVAAVVLLTASLLVFFLAGGPEPPETAPVAIDPPKTSPAPKLPPIQTVATLTDQVNAHWRYGDLPVELNVGTTLSPWQRLTLTHGFAELTTERGAKVLLQAPATFEITDHDNAIRLHQGKLVGTCETVLSQGFTVHTSSMDVVDLGTRFGVEAQADGTSTVLVMDGSVRAQPTPKSPRAFEPVVLEKDQVRRTVAQTGGLEMIAVSEAPAFYGKTPSPYVASVLEAEPVTYWRFEQNDNGTVVNEVAPGSNDLRVSGSASITPDGIHGSAASLSGDRQPLGYFAMQGTLAEVSEADAFTIECWFYADQVQRSSLFSLYTATQDEFLHHALLELQPDEDVSPSDDSGWGQRSIRGIHADPPIEDGAMATNLFSSTPYKTKRWHHAVLVKDGEALQLFIDGRLERESKTGVQVHADVEVSLGLTLLQRVQADAPLEQIRPFSGRIDEAAIYDRPLSADEIKGHWSIGTGQLNH